MANATTRASVSPATRSRRDLRLLLLLALACAAGLTVLRAQETTPPATPAAEAPATGEPGVADEPEKIDFPDAPDPGATPPAQPASQPSPPPTSGAAEQEPADDEEPPPDATPRTPGVVGPTPGRFEPTEKVRADFDVSFPVDI